MAMYCQISFLKMLDPRPNVVCKQASKHKFHSDQLMLDVQTAILSPGPGSINE